MNEVYTYFEPILPGAGPIIGMWRKSWSLAGWKPVVLGRVNAARHPLYIKLLAAARRLPTVNPKSYETACYVRYLAMATIGGGLMVDGDVMNNGLRPGNVQLSLGFHTLDTNGVPCAVFGTAGDYDRFAKRIIDWPPSKYEHVNGVPHMSDMYIMMAAGFPRSEQCLEYGVPGWQTAPLIHFAACRAGCGNQKTKTIFGWLSKKLVEKTSQNRKV